MAKDMLQKSVGMAVSPQQMACMEGVLVWLRGRMFFGMQ